MENVHIHILNSGKRLTPFLETIQKATDEVLPLIHQRLPLSNVDIIVADNPSKTISSIGVGGSADTPNLLFVWIDPDHPGLDTKLSREIKSTLAHELHHVIRSRSYQWPVPLLDYFVTEGLSDHFDIEINKTNPQPWSVALTKEEISTLLKKAEPDFFSMEYDTSRWFFGSEDLPKWTGYSIGFKIAGDYLEKTGKKASELVSLDAREFLK